MRDSVEGNIRKYQNRAIQAAQVIEELIALAKNIREEAARGTELGLTEDEIAFYDALEVNDSAVKVLGDETLKMIARELVETVRSLHPRTSTKGETHHVYSKHRSHRIPQPSTRRTDRIENQPAPYF